MMLPFERIDHRKACDLRPIHFELDIAPHALGSVLVSFGQTKVICAATIEAKVPAWMKSQGLNSGWLTAEYSMLPYSTHERKTRESSQSRLDGRTVEIQRLIGRSLRAVVDLRKMPGQTLHIDCDVLQADGGTRTAAISGAYVAAQMAFNRLIRKNKKLDNPIQEALAAVSVGVYENIPLLDLCYVEDKDASVDANIVMTESGKFVEIQCCGEGSTYNAACLQSLLDLAQKGIQEIFQFQKNVLDIAQRCA